MCEKQLVPPFIPQNLPITLYTAFFISSITTNYYIRGTKLIYYVNQKSIT